MFGSWAIFFAGVIVGLIAKEFLPPDVVNKIGKVKLKNSNENQLDLDNPFTPVEPKKGLLKRIFKRNNK